MPPLRSRPIYYQLRLLSVLSALALVLLALFGALRARSDAKTAFVRETEHVVEAGAGIVKDFIGHVKSGEMTEEQAKAAALAALEGMRYGDGDYLYVTNKDDIFVMHPVKPELEGTSFADMKDKNGVTFLRDMNHAAIAKGNASLVYQWAKPGQTIPSPKLGVGTFVPEWGWVVFGGLYIDDVSKAFWKYLGFASALLVVIMTALLLVARSISKSITGPLLDTTERKLVDLVHAHRTVRLAQQQLV